MDVAPKTSGSQAEIALAARNLTRCPLLAVPEWELDAGPLFMAKDHPFFQGMTPEKFPYLHAPLSWKVYLFQAQDAVSCGNQ